ncbi:MULTISPECIES: HEAT repeat domain-containing protein [unclassified Desulfurobacterium]|uniref:HEAT repeat domain-containing protein n=1 Tax=Desulfurobacterium sp. TC5-1 TaxID=1158318 RepID=UPI0003B47F95|nr:HEAT repeat domain-containing protein [Desulfurobacterium sp. TC5-1]
MKRFIAVLSVLMMGMSAFAAPFNLNAKDPQDRVLAVFYLSRTKDPVYVKPFCQLLLKDKSEKVRKAAAEGLGYYGNSAEALNCLLDAFKKEKAEDVREAVLISLFSFSDGRAGKLFCQVLNGNYPSNLRVVAIKGLAKYDICSKELQKVIEIGNRDEVKAALFALYFRRDSVKGVSKYLGSKDSDLRFLAISYYLTHSPSEAVLKRIEENLGTETDPKVKAKALEVILTYDKNPDIDTFLSAISDEDIKRRLALRLPFVKNRKISSKLLKPFLNDNDTIILTSALTYIGNSGNRRYCSLVKDFLFSPDESVRSAAMWAEGRLSCPEGVKYLLGIVSDFNNDDSLRLQAAKMLLMFNKDILKKNLSVLQKVYNNEILDDVKDNLYKVIAKAKG